MLFKLHLAHGCLANILEDRNEGNFLGLQCVGCTFSAEDVTLIPSCLPSLFAISSFHTPGIYSSQLPRFELLRMCGTEGASRLPAFMSLGAHHLLTQQTFTCSRAKQPALRPAGGNGPQDKSISIRQERSWCSKKGIW